MISIPSQPVTSEAKDPISAPGETLMRTSAVNPIPLSRTV